MKRFILTSILLAALTFGAFNGSAPKSSHVEGKALLTLEQEITASTTQLEAHYKTSSSFLSEVYESDYPFQLLGINWEEELPANTASQIEIRFQTRSGAKGLSPWTDWQPIESDQDGAYSDNGFWTYVITEDATAFQYRANLSTSDQSVAPKLSNISFDYVAGGSEPLLSRLIFKNDNGEIIERDDWGADEDYRLSENYVFTASESYQELDDDEVAEDPDMEIVETVYTDEDGNDLLWPLEYPKEVKKIIVHHTATTSNLDDPEEAIRAIYYYHAMTRSWGDIGYNFIIDQEGNVYEGRYGGDGVVAGHAAGYNTGSVGIALLGNYEDSPVPGEMVQSLTDLIYEKAQVHDINPDGSSRFRDESMANILGHSDVASTACPGDYVYELLDGITDIVDASLNEAKHKNYEDEFAFEEVSDLELITLDPMDKTGVSIRIENTGDETWNSDTFLTVNANHEADEIVTIEKDEDKLVAEMKEDEVAPGEIASFAFQVESNMIGGLAHFDASPIFNGEHKTLNYIDLGVYVERPQIDFDVEEEDVEEVLKPGESAIVTVVLENESNFTWDDTVELKRSGSSELVSSKTLATLQEDEVKPGENGTFEFEIEAPTSGGVYSLYYYPDVDDSNVVVNSSARLSVQVMDSEEDALILDSSADLTFMPGETRYIWLQVQNTSVEKWYTSGDDAFTLSFDEPSGMGIDNQRFTMKAVAPGVSTKVYFQVTAPDEIDEYELGIRPKLGSQNLTSSYFELEITVNDSVALSADDYENPIRIKLTPDDGAGAPVLTSYSAFALYDDEELLKTFSANSRVRITPDGDEFIVTSGSYKWTVDGPVRMTPQEEDGLVRILTMSQIASWDSSINDNKFRGTMEVQFVDGEAILINELPLENYLKGLAEETNETPEEKLKAMAILARSYAYYYMTQDEKFPGMSYHLEDDPATSQKYLGYGYEERHPNVPEAVEETENVVVTYDGEIIKTPYFSRSDGVSTKSPEEVWGWAYTPYLIPVDDSHCDSDEFWGHGVGLSGCGAKALAEDGYSFEEIIKYYYTGTDLDEIE